MALTIPTTALSVALSSALMLVAGCPSDDVPTETTVAAETGTTVAAETGTTVAAETGTTVAAETETTAAAETDATSTTTAGADSTTGAAACDPPPTATDDCCCFTTTEIDQSTYVDNSCPAESLCGSLQIECPTGPDCPLLPKVGGEGELTVSDEVALECILTALRDGTQGTLTWTYTSTNKPGYAYFDQTVHVLSDRVVLYSALDVVDLGGEYSDVTRETLRPAADYDACLQGADLSAQLSCLLRPTDNQVIEVCTEGGTYSKF